jgi:Bacterial Ig domain/Secretion system C-terminal sorting domain
MKTKNLILGLGIALLGNVAAHAQGLEGIIVEKYYKTNAADAAGSVGVLPAGSTTYRIYVDMAAGYKLQAVYGDAVHNLKINTTTHFFNSEDRGATTPNGIGTTFLKNNANALDSWVSMGGAASGQLGVLKSEDNGAANFIVGDAILNNAPASIGIPVKTQDGMIAGALGTITMAGISTELDILDNVSQAGNQILFDNQAYSVAGGVSGATATNRVLIGQFTTDGVFHYELNIQMAIGATVEKYVSAAPGSGELTHASLLGTFGTPPTVSITAPTTGANYITGNVVSIAANAADTDGSVASVEFLVDGVSANTDATAPYTHTLVSTVGTHTITAKATDDDGQTATSSAVIINVVNNALPTVTLDAPTTGTSYITGAPINFSATAADADGTIDSVVFYRGAVRVGKALQVASPFTFTLTSTVGAFALTAKAYDNLGAVTTSAAKNITVGNNVAPTVSITAPANGGSVLGGIATTTVTITAGAADVDGTVSSVEFFVNNVSIGTDVTSPFSIDWISSAQFGPFSLTAKATDNFGDNTTSAAIAFTIDNPAGNPYKIDSIAAICAISNFCLPINKVLNPAADVIGFDMVLHYDKSRVTPTEVISAGTLANPNYVTIAHSTNSDSSLINISVSLNNAATAGTTFHGIGELICVGFSKTNAFGTSDKAVFTITNFKESKVTGVTSVNVDRGSYSTYKDSTLTGQLKFWADNSVINNNVATDIYTNSLVGGNAHGLVHPDNNGLFTMFPSGQSLSTVAFNVVRDIDDSKSVQAVVNGFDALLARKVVINDLSFIPNVYQILAMDVNQDGVISAGDVSQMNQRSVKTIGEFKQAWNYNNDGSKKAGKGASHDWVFIDANTLTTNGAYMISSIYPGNDGVGFSKLVSPILTSSVNANGAFNIPANITDPSGCPVIAAEVLTGILLGDVNGNYKSIAADGILKSATTDKIVFDLSNAIANGDIISIPVSVVSEKAINALDFAMQLDGGVTYNSIVNKIASLTAMDNLDATDATLRFTSYSLENLDLTKPVVSVNVKADKVNKDDLKALVGYLNGDKVNVEVVDGSISAGVVANSPVTVYPVPASTTVNVLAAANATAQLIDMDGNVVVTVNVNANQAQAISTANLANGVYTLKVASANFVQNVKVVVAK